MSFKVDYRNHLDQTPENQAALALKAVGDLADVADLIGDINIDDATRYLAECGQPQTSLDLMRSLFADFTALMDKADEAAEQLVIESATDMEMPHPAASDERNPR